MKHITLSMGKDELTRILVSKSSFNETIIHRIKIVARSIKHIFVNGIQLTHLSSKTSDFSISHKQ